MAIQLINNTPYDGQTGDLNAVAWTKANNNFTYLKGLIDDAVTEADLEAAVNGLQEAIDDVTEALDDKADRVHTHTISQIVGLQNALNSKVNTSTFNFKVNQINILISKLNLDIAELQAGVSEAVTHNETQGLQGGAPDEFYHLTESQYDRVMDLIYVNNVTTLGLSPNTGEKGVGTSFNLTYNIKPNDDILLVASINQGVGSVIGNANGAPHTVAQGPLVDSRTYTLTLEFMRQGGTDIDTYTANYNAYTPQFAGVSGVEDYTTYSAMTSTLQKFVQSSATLQRSMSPSIQYVWFVSTKSNAAILDQNNFSQTIGNWGDSTTEFWKKSINLTLADGTSSSTVYLYRTRLPKTFNNIIYKIQ